MHVHGHYIELLESFKHTEANLVIKLISPPHSLNFLSTDRQLDPPNYDYDVWILQ